MLSALPVVTGNCPSCGSEELAVISHSPATREVLVSCECGEQWWEEGVCEDGDESK